MAHGDHAPPAFVIGAFAAPSLKNGVDVKTLSSAWDRYSAGFTPSTCTHATAEMERDAADTIGNVNSQAM